jgi:hypothetical protein
MELSRSPFIYTKTSPTHFINRCDSSEVKINHGEYQSSHQSYSCAMEAKSCLVKSCVCMYPCSEPDIPNLRFFFPQSRTFALVQHFHLGMIIAKYTLQGFALVVITHPTLYCCTTCTIAIRHTEIESNMTRDA